MWHKVWNLRKMIVDCANDSKLAEELIAYLKENNIQAYIQDGLIMTAQDLKLENLEIFLKHTGRHKHKAQLLDKMKFLLSIPSNVEEFGLESCEFCGYTGYPEIVEIHRKTHGAL